MVDIECVFFNSFFYFWVAAAGRRSGRRPTNRTGDADASDRCVRSSEPKHSVCDVQRCDLAAHAQRSERSFFFRRFFFRRHRHRPHPRGRERFEWTLKTMQPVASNKSMSGRRSARRRVEEKRGSMTGNHLSSAAVKGGGISEGRLILRTIAGMRCGRHRFTTAKKKYNNKPKQTRRRRRWK